jgi:hypothetical protein
MGVSGKTKAVDFTKKVILIISGIVIFLILLAWAVVGSVGQENEPTNLLEPQATYEKWDAIKQDKITVASRAPLASDKGSLWIQYTANDDTTINICVRHPNSGTWRCASAT